MREIGLYGLFYGVEKTVTKFGFEESIVKQLILKAFEDPFIQVLRELLKSSIMQTGIEETSKIYKISQKSLQVFSDFHNLLPFPTAYNDLLTEEWFGFSLDSSDKQ